MTGKKTYDADTYLILSLKWSRGDLLTWWGPNNSGYTPDLLAAGRYTREQVAGSPGYYDNEDSTRAIPEREIHSTFKIEHVVRARLVNPERGVLDY